MVDHPGHTKASLFGGEDGTTHIGPRCSGRIELDIKDHTDILPVVKPLSSAPSLEEPAFLIGRQTVHLVDAQRDGRALSVDVWYPAMVTDEQLAQYEVLPGVSFTAAAARAEPPISHQNFPLILFSHGRTGMRHAYSLLCEALAARGAIVVSADHPGDGLFDWALGTQVDDRTNEINRLGDASFLLDQALSPDSALGRWAGWITDVVVIGHSYGAYTAFAAVAGARGAPADQRVKAVVGMQAYTRVMSDAMLARVGVPFLLVVGEQDVTTPASTDADRVFELASSPMAWRVDIAGAAHQACSDMGLYLEVADQIEGLPQLVLDYLASMAPDTVGGVLRPWRENLLLHVQAIWAFLNSALLPDRGNGAPLAALKRARGVTVRREPQPTV